jgi:tetratricopeptide (TPR) repeat protein
MYRRICSLIGVAVLAACTSEYVAAGDEASMIKNADTYVSEKKFDRARAIYERAQTEGMRLETDLPHARNLAAVYLNSTPPDLARAILWLQVAVTLDPQSDSLRAQLASSLYRSGNFEAAIDQYKVLVEAHPTSAEYVIPLSTALRQAGKSDAALQFLQASTEKHPNLVAIRIEYARQLNFAKQFPEARKQFSAVLAIEPQNLIAQVGLAKATSYEGDQETAIEMYDRILQRHSGSYDAIVGKAFSLLWSGRTEQAGELLRKASARNPDDHEVREALSTLPHSAGASAAMPERNRQLYNPRYPALRRPPNPEKPESQTAPSLDRVVPSQPEHLLPEQKQQHQNGAAVAIIGFCLTLASFAYGRSRSGHLKSQRGETESLSSERTPDLPVSTVDRDSGNGSVMLESAPQSTAAVGTITETPEEDSIPPAPSTDERTTAARQPSLENSVALPDIVDQEVHEHSHPSAPHPRDLSRVQIGGGGTSDDLVESHEPVVAAQELVPEAKLKVLLVGGRPHEVELENRWFPITANEILWERNWGAAVQCLASAPPDLIVLNPLSDDGRTSEQMFNWIITNRAEFRNRTIVINGQTELSRREHYLVEPFGAPQWRQAVMIVAHRTMSRLSWKNGERVCPLE